MEELRDSYRILVENSNRKGPVGTAHWEDVGAGGMRGGIKRVLGKWCEVVIWIRLGQNENL